MAPDPKFETIKIGDCECYSHVHTKSSCPPVKNVTHPLRYYEFTKDEIKALEECDKESFYRRCLPFSTLLGAGTYLAVKKGLLGAHPVYGVFPKLGVAVVLGHLLGRVIYIPNCENKLTKLHPDSYLGKVMRQHEINRNLPIENVKKK